MMSIKIGQLDINDRNGELVARVWLDENELTLYDETITIDNFLAISDKLKEIIEGRYQLIDTETDLTITPEDK